MAQLRSRAALDQRVGRWDSRQTWAQYAAIASLRWRMFINLSRRANSAGEITGRVILFVVLGGGAIFLTVAAGGAAEFLTSSDHLQSLWIELWVIFALCQLLNVQLGQPGTTFDPTELIRFPLRVPTYVAIRLFFNLLSPANVMALLMSLAVAVGVTLAMPRLWFFALLACLVFAITNVLFSRMVFAWVDRWLSTRRAREVFTAAIFIVSLGIQYLNFTFNPAYSRHSHDTHSRTQSSAVTRQRVAAASSVYRRAEPYVRFLPPHLVSGSLDAAAAGQPLTSLADIAGCGGYAALFLLVFSLRMRTEFRGESISDSAGSASVPTPRSRLLIPAAAPATPATFPAAGVLAPSGQSSLLPTPMLGVLTKEWIYMRRNVGLLYGLLTPLFLVVMAAIKWGHNAPAAWVVPVALMYSLLGIAPMSYNSLGLDGTGAQMYFMAPVPLRQVFLAKNLLHFGLAAVEVIAVLAVTAYVTALPHPLMLLGLLLWAGGTLLLNTSLGNRRSVTAPKKINLGKMAGKQASQTSGLISLGIMAACGAYGAAILALVAYFGMPWLTLPCFAALAAAGVLVYRASLQSIQAFTLAHRDTLFEELGKS